MSNSVNQPDALAELKALSKIIQDSIDTIEGSVKSKNLKFPSAHTPLTMESEAARMLPDVDGACSSIISAASQLIYSVRSPMLSIVAVATQHEVSAALGVAAASNAAEACREAGSQGAHVKDIARASNIDPSKLSRILRTLATNHIFEEIAPDVFINNRISSTMDTGKSVKALLDSPDTKHIGTMGIAAGVGHCTDEIMKAASHLQETLFDPKLAASQEPTETATNVAFGTKLSVFEWFETKGNEHRLVRFGITMEGSKQAALPTAILQGFGWSGLDQDALVVDVGGGIGGQSLILAQNCPNLRFVVQDRENVIKDAAAFWDEQMPDAVKSGRVVLQGHDFFTPQPVKNAAVFLLRNILHDWPDKYCVQILNYLRQAAAPFTQLVIIDNLLSYACTEEGLENVPGANRPLPPFPLLPNGGYASAISYSQDLMMMQLLNGKERTTTQMGELLKQAGWKLVRVDQGSAFSTAKTIAVPA